MVRNTDYDNYVITILQILIRNPSKIEKKYIGIGQSIGVFCYQYRTKFWYRHIPSRNPVLRDISWS